MIMARWMRAFAVLTLGAANCFGQFTIGSTGADGALNFSTPGTFDFDPVVLGKDVDGDNIYHFTTINIGAGVTLKLRASKVRNRSVVWLATGAVTIAGTLDLSGADGNPASIGQARVFAEPGPGGYPGGAGGQTGSPATAGFGPGGGPYRGINTRGCGASHALASACSGLAYGNTLIVPLRGGSGGGGGSAVANNPGAGGGAGGGAIRIVSSGTITVSGPGQKWRARI